jgi:hypothetical protein
MKSILLKIEDELYSGLEATAKELKISKTGFIKKSIIAYKKAINDKIISNQLAKESFLVREESMIINSEFEITLLDGLNDY